MAQVTRVAVARRPPGVQERDTLPAPVLLQQDPSTAIQLHRELLVRERRAVGMKRLLYGTTTPRQVLHDIVEPRRRFERKQCANVVEDFAIRLDRALLGGHNTKVYRSLSRGARPVP
jgi:hypothetical protein